MRSPSDQRIEEQLANSFRLRIRSNAWIEIVGTLIDGEYYGVVGRKFWAATRCEETGNQYQEDRNPDIGLLRKSQRKDPSNEEELRPSLTTHR